MSKILLFRLKKNLSQKNIKLLGKTKIMGQKSFWVKKKLLGQKKISGSKVYFESKKILGQKIFGPKNILGSKKLWVKFFFGKKI